MTRKKSDKRSLRLLSDKKMGSKRTFIKHKNIPKDLLDSFSKRSYKIKLVKMYKHKVDVYVYKYKLIIRDGNNQTFINAFNKMVNNIAKYYPKGRIKIVPLHDIIFTKHKAWPIRTFDTVKKLFMEQMERLLQSADELDINEVIFEVTIYPNRMGRGKDTLKILNIINKRSIIQIKNDDTICLSRAIITALAYNNWLEEYYTVSQLKHIKEGRTIQERVAKELHEKANVEIKEEGNNLDDLKDFEKYLKIRILVFTSNSIEHLPYKGNEEYDDQIYLYYHDEHFDVVTNITGFLAKRRFCEQCLIGYTNQHTCNGVLQSRGKQWKCKKCKNTFSEKYQKPETHICNELTCHVCYDKYMKDTEHLCYMKPLSPKEVKDNKYIYFDFEANQETGIHIMNFCIAYDSEYIYCFRKNYIQRYKCDFDIFDIDLSKLDINNIFDDVEKLESKHNSVIDNFCKYFIRDEFKNYTFISHYGKGYDMQPILGWIVENKIAIKNPITAGLKISLIEIKGINLRFIDSINFTLCGLAAFPGTFGFNGNKGYFPHYFNTTEYQRYKGPYPNKKYYGYNTMTIKNKGLFDNWYNTVKDKEFKFHKEILYYCLLDVLILAKGCTIYKDQFIKITENSIDPFQSMTIAQCCTKIFKTLMLEEGTIGIHKQSTFEETHSLKEIQWLEYLSNKDDIMIRHVKRGGEKTIFTNWRYYKLDGYYYDRLTKTRHVYEFYGCYFHGCPKCYHPDEICKIKSRKTMKELYSKTLEREDIIKRYFRNSVIIHTIWECEFDKNKYPEVDPEITPINKRDAFYGGRTETIQLYNNTPNLKAKYVDFCSLYPSVNKFCEYPVGHPITYNNLSVEDYLSNNYFGIMKCKIIPPRGLYHPVLPFKQNTGDNNHKLIFGLCRSCMNKLSIKCTHIEQRTFISNQEKAHAIKHCKECKEFRNKKCKHTNEERSLIGTWATIEINKAIEKGYKLIKIYELEHFKKTSTDIFKSYVNKFMKYKLEASGCKCNYKLKCGCSNKCKEVHKCPNQIENKGGLCDLSCKNDNKCETKIQYIIDNAAYDLDINKVKYNPGLRLIAKICLNSLWGHFGMRDNFSQKEYCYNSEQLTNIVFNDKYDDVNIMILDKDTILAEYKNKKEYSKPNTSVNIYIALFTTAHARLKLYELLDNLQERVMYLDTDSVVYHDDGSETCKKIEKMMGTKLGDLTDEIVSKHNANHIVQFASTGPKDYSFKLDTGKVVNHCKGFRVNEEVEKKITLDKKIKLITNENESYETITYNQITVNRKDKKLINKEQVKMYDFEFDKRMIHYENLFLINSFPYGI